MNITKRNKQKGFTLIELMVGIAIVGLLSSVILVATKGSTDKANIAKTMQWSRSIESLLGPYAVGIWNFDEGSGTTVSDLSGYGNDGTLVNNPTWRCAEDDSSYTPSGQGCALEFDGGDYTDMGNDVSLDLIKEITMSAWIKRIGSGGCPRIISKQYSSLDTAGSCFQLGIACNLNETRFAIGGKFDIRQGPDLALNQWYHLLTIYDGITANAKIYVNSDEVWSSSSYNGLIRSNPEEPLTIAKSYFEGSTNYHFNGFIDDVRIYETALTSAQVEALYYAGLDNLYAKSLIDKQEYQERLLAKQGF
jgi:prepilin-type N-terminal cleavage/methylation domain-containing protein